MKRQLLSLPIIPDELDIYTDKDKIAEMLGVSLTQEKSPNLFFFHKNSFYKFEGYDWKSETKKYYIWDYGLSDGFKLENLQSDLLEADKLKVHKDLLLEIVAAAYGKKLN